MVILYNNLSIKILKTKNSFNMKQIVILLGFFFPLILLSQVSDTYEIYSKIINKDFKKYNKITIENFTDSRIYRLNDSSYVFIKNELTCLKKETFENFIDVNKEIDTLKNNFKTKKEILILSTIEVDNIFETNSSWENDYGWDDFYKKFGDTQGLLEFSRVGYSKDHYQALVYFGNQSHGQAGCGYYVLFEKKGKRWLRRGKYLAWIS